MSDIKPLVNSNDIRSRLYSEVTGKAKNILSSWTGQLDAPTEELRTIEALFGFIEEQQSKIDKLEKVVEACYKYVDSGEHSFMLNALAELKDDGV